MNNVNEFLTDAEKAEIEAYEARIAAHYAKKAQYVQKAYATVAPKR